MHHYLELFIPILEILEIGVFNILYNPGNIGKRLFLIFSYPGNWDYVDHTWELITPTLEIGSELIQSSNCYYMDQGLELFIPILDILEIEICNILYNPGNIGKRIFLIQSYPVNVGQARPWPLQPWWVHMKAKYKYTN